MNWKLLRDMPDAVPFMLIWLRARNKDEMLDQIGRALAFPEWFGHNWDALADCLLDMGWRPALGLW